jgi:uncharacterized protein
MLLALLLAVAAPPKGHWGSDETGRVLGPTLAAFDAIAQELDQSGRGQLGLAVVGSTAGAPPRAFAAQVFNAWGIGHGGHNDGVLLFLALDDRKAEIVLGDGFPAGTSSLADRVMRDESAFGGSPSGDGSSGR